MKKVKMYVGLLKADLKRKLWLVLLSWYTFGMFCFLFATKATIPSGEIRSLYVGPGNTSFFAAMVIFGIVMGITGFRYLGSERKADLLFSLPFSKSWLFLAGLINDFLIFAVPVTVCKILFFRISISMGYSQYENGVKAMWIGCLVLMLGFLFLQNLSVLAVLLTQNTGYTLGVLLLFLLGPDLGLNLAEKMMRIFIPFYYRSEILEKLKGYLSPVSLLRNAAGTGNYVDGADWILGKHLSYICILGILAVFLSCINCVLFSIRPVERKRSVFIFRPAEWFVRYVCIMLAVLWLADALQILTFGGYSKELVMGVVLLGVPVVHGLVNVIVAFDAKKFLSGKWHLLGEYIFMGVLLGIFFLAGQGEENMPAKDSLDSLAVVMTAIDSGDECDAALSQMYLTKEELSRSYDWIEKNCTGQKATGIVQGDSCQVLVCYRLKEGKKKYRKYDVSWDALDEFGEIFSGEEFKEGMFSSLTLDSLKYYEIQWSNGLETYVLDLNEEERKALWEAYIKDFMALTFSEFRQQVPIGCFTLCSTKNQDDRTGYIYPSFMQTKSLLWEYGIDSEKSIEDYDIIQILVYRYLVTEGFLYDVRSLEWEKEITEGDYINGLAEVLHYEGFFVDPLLNQKNSYLEFMVSYRDSEGRTISRIRCGIQTAYMENEVLQNLMGNVKNY